jgi:predicted porin
MTSLKKLLVVLAASLPLAASAQPAAEPPPAAPPPAAAPEATPPPAPPAPAKPAAAPAAAKPLFQIYGTLNVNFQVTEAPNATNPAQSVDYRTGVSVDSTNIGIRGTADVAYGLGVVYQCETSAQIDAIGVSGLCNRNSRLGVSSPYGTLFYGNWDTPYKAMTYGTKADDVFGNTDVYGIQNIISSPGFNGRSSAFIAANPGGPDAAGAFPAGAATPSFDIRAQNSVAYHSPKVAGVSAKLQYSTDEFATANSVLTPRLYSAAVNFDFGPLSVTGGAEVHEDAFGLAVINLAPATDGSPAARPAFGATVPNSSTVSSMDWAWRVAAGYELAWAFGTTTVNAAVEQLTYEQDDAVTNQISDYDRMAYAVGAKHRMGNHEFRARYSLADDGDCTGVGFSCSTDGYGAWNLALGYAHHLSKAAQVYVYYTLLENEAQAQYTFATAGVAAVAGATPRGADPYAAGLGLRYAF